MTAYYQVPAAERPRVRVYDTGTQSVADALTQARAQGADFIVGPADARGGDRGGGVPGRSRPAAGAELPARRSSPRRRSSTSSRCRRRTRRAWRRGACSRITTAAVSRCVPAGDWGTRVLAAFKQELQRRRRRPDRRRARSMRRARITRATITEVLRISDSNARHKRLESMLGTKLHVRAAAPQRHRVHLRAGAGQHRAAAAAAAALSLRRRHSHLRDLGCVRAGHAAPTRISTG